MKKKKAITTVNYKGKTNLYNYIDKLLYKQLLVQLGCCMYMMHGVTRDCSSKGKAKKAAWLEPIML